MNLTNLKDFNCIKELDCFTWCKEQHFANNNSGLWILIWSTTSLLMALCLPLLKDFIDDFIDAKTLFIMQKLLYFVALALNLGYMLWVISK